MRSDRAKQAIGGADGSSTLSIDDASAFARNGFVRLRGAVSRRLCERLIEETWARLPPGWRRDDASSWVGESTDSCHTADVARRGGLLKFRTPELKRDADMRAAFGVASAVQQVAAALIGTPLRQVQFRGLYAIAPLRTPVTFADAPNPHIEAHPIQIFAMCYLRDVEQGGGGLSVWPGSHREFHQAFDSRFDYVARPHLDALMDRYRRTRPIELLGRQGDVWLVHHRLLHSPTMNRSSRIRFAFLCDYVSLAAHTLRAAEHSDDIWEDWPGLLSLIGPNQAAEPADYPVRRESGVDFLKRLLVHSIKGARWLPARSSHRSAINKVDAGELARMRRPGDIWLSISDSPAWFERSGSLDPQGDDLARCGTRVFHNGVELRSQSRGDITVRLPALKEPSRIEIFGIDAPLWIRVVEMGDPFANSRVVFRAAISAVDAYQFEIRRSDQPV